jgi:hypothetical protein
MVGKISFRAIPVPLSAGSVLPLHALRMVGPLMSAKTTWHRLPRELLNDRRSGAPSKHQPSARRVYKPAALPSRRQIENSLRRPDRRSTDVREHLEHMEADRAQLAHDGQRDLRAPREARRA